MSQRKTGRDPVRARESKLGPEGVSVGVTESHREPVRDRERSSKSQREKVKA